MHVFLFNKYDESKQPFLLCITLLFTDINFLTVIMIKNLNKHNVNLTFFNALLQYLTNLML